MAKGENENVEVNDEEQDANVEQNDASENDASNETQPAVEYVTVDAFNELRDTITNFSDTMNKIMGGIKSIRDAQGVMVRAGMVVQDDADPEPEDDFKPLSELDFSVKR